jgi:hypothetical protein
MTPTFSSDIKIMVKGSDLQRDKIDETKEWMRERQHFPRESGLGVCCVFPKPMKAEST